VISARPGHSTSRPSSWARQMDILLEEAHALAGLGRCALVAGHTSEAEESLRQALAIFRRIGSAETTDVSAELDSLHSTPDASIRLFTEM
jgi:Tfp pilus assembly protein PilF